MVTYKNVDEPDYQKLLDDKEFFLNYDEICVWAYNSVIGCEVIKADDNKLLDVKAIDDEYVDKGSEFKVCYTQAVSSLTYDICYDKEKDAKAGDVIYFGVGKSEIDKYAEYKDKKEYIFTPTLISYAKEDLLNLKDVQDTEHFFCEDKQDRLKEAGEINESGVNIGGTEPVALYHGKITAVSDEKIEISAYEDYSLKEGTAFSVNISGDTFAGYNLELVDTDAKPDEYIPEVGDLVTIDYQNTEMIKDGALEDADYFTDNTHEVNVFKYSNDVGVKVLEQNSDGTFKVETLDDSLFGNVAAFSLGKETKAYTRSGNGYDCRDIKAGDTLYFACGKYDVDNYTKSDDKETYVMNPTFTFEDAKTLEEFSFSTLYSSPEQAR